MESTSANRSRRTEAANPYNRTLGMPRAMGGWAVDTLPGLAG